MKEFIKQYEAKITELQAEKDTTGVVLGFVEGQILAYKMIILHISKQYHERIS